MNKQFRIFCVFLSAVLCIGMTAKAGMIGSLSSSNDTISTTSLDIESPESSVIDEVIWVVGDEAILKSDVETMRMQAETEGIRFKGDPDCAIPEQIAVEKLFLHQAAIDSLEVTEAEISQGVEAQINEWVNIVGITLWLY